MFYIFFGAIIFYKLPIILYLIKWAFVNLFSVNHKLKLNIIGLILDKKLKIVYKIFILIKKVIS